MTKRGQEDAMAPSCPRENVPPQLHRRFIDPAQPLAPLVAKDLLRGRSGLLSLRDTITVVPTLEAGRRLRYALAALAAEQGTGLLTGPVLTPMQLVTHGHTTAKLADDATSLGVWVGLLDTSASGAWPHLFPVEPPVRDTAWRIKTALMLRGVRMTLADGGFRASDLASRDDLPRDEQLRWHELAKLEHHALDALKKQGLQDPVDFQLACANNPCLPDEIQRLVIAATPDPTPLMILALRNLTQRYPVDILIQALPEEADDFDEWGRPRPECWTERPIEWPSDHELVVCAEPADLAERVEWFLHAKEGGGVIGLPDEALRSCVDTGIERAGYRPHDPGGHPIALHPCGQLIHAYGQVRFEQELDGMTSLLRHAGVLDALSREDDESVASDLLAQWDAFLEHHLPANISQIFELMPRVAADYPRLATAMSAIQQRLHHHADLAVDEAIADWFTWVYTDTSLVPGQPDDDLFLSAGRLILESAQAQAEACRRLGGHDPALTFALWWSQLSAQSIYTARPDESVDVSGWLELPWHPAPSLLVVGMNEGAVPDGQRADLFLPDSLKNTLGLRSDRQRHARDAYAMTAMIRQRTGHGKTTWLVARSAPGGDVRQPSRLVLQCRRDELVARVHALFRSRVTVRNRAAPAIPFRLSPPLTHPDVQRRLKPTKLSVSRLKRYLQCPFGYFLDHVLDMQEIETGKPEMSPPDFGQVMHGVLASLFTDPVLKDCTDPERVTERLGEQLDKILAFRFGAHPPLHVDIQALSIRQRLRAFSEIHTQWIHEGWRIHAVECKGTLSVGKVELSGRIDRIDVHPDHGWRVIDYKTADKAITPIDAHLRTVREDSPPATVVDIDGKSRCWIDLQLPLYQRMIAAEHRTQLPIDVGYVNLPKAVTETSWEPWPDMTGEIVDSSLVCTAWIIDQLHANRFWPPDPRSDLRGYERLFPNGVDENFDPSALIALMEETP